MAYAGGGFTAYNKKLPGVYVNFISLASAGAAAASRGTAAIGLTTDWGDDEKIISMDFEDFCKNAYLYFGVSAADDKLRAVRDVFQHAQRLLCFRLNGGGTAASCDLATAKCSGTAGNNLRVAVQNDVDDESKYLVSVFFGDNKVDEQRVGSFADLQDNDYVSFSKSASVQVTAGMPLTGGTNGEATREKHQKFLNLLESYAFDTVGLASEDTGLKALYKEYTVRMRNSGKKFQAVLYDYEADDEGIVNVGNAAVDGNKAAGVYWVTGLCAGLEANESAFNRIYDGEYELKADFTALQLEQATEKGVFLLHKVGSELRVLADINSLVSTSMEKGDIFCDNRTVRVIDRIATDTASLFTEKYMGKYPNNHAGRAALWSDIVELFRSLNRMGAVEDFDSESISVEAGSDRKSVLISQTVTLAGTMEKLYMTCVLK